MISVTRLYALRNMCYDKLKIVASAADYVYLIDGSRVCEAWQP